MQHAYSYLKHQRLELLIKYECSDVIIIPKSVWRILDDPKFVEISGVRNSVAGGASSISRLGASSVNLLMK